MTKAQVFGLGLGDARRHTGSVAQFARIDAFVETNGPGSGSRRLRMINGGGLEVDIHPDRTLDLGQATFDGIPIAWLEAKGIVSPHAFEPSGQFMRTFGGGLLATCGLDTFGAPSVDNGETFGMHGRIGAQPAIVETTSITGDSLLVTGQVRQSSVFGEDLMLERRIESRIGSSSVSITDRVTNEGRIPQAHMVLYHANFGWPLLAPGCELRVNSSERVGIDPRATAEPEGWNRFDPPDLSYEERVYRHQFTAKAKSLGNENVEAFQTGEATLLNPELGLGVTVRFDRSTLPHLFEWKMLGEGTYVVGLEPANCETMSGRADARRNGTLPFLNPGESVTHRLEFAFHRKGARGTSGVPVFIQE
jgi:hypothetical protein